MAFRKLDLKNRHSCFCNCELNWKDPVIVTEKSTNGMALRVNSTVSEKSCKEINKEQLNPNLVTLEGMLEAGVTLDPNVVKNFMNPTDISEIQERSSKLSENLYKVLVEQELIKLDEN